MVEVKIWESKIEGGRKRNEDGLFFFVHWNFSL
jgi:hypothetical protein